MNSALEQLFPNPDVFIVTVPSPWQHSVRDETAETSVMYYLKDGAHASFSLPAFKSNKPGSLHEVSSDESLPKEKQNLCFNIAWIN